MGEIGDEKVERLGMRREIGDKRGRLGIREEI